MRHQNQGSKSRGTTPGIQEGRPSQPANQAQLSLEAGSPRLPPGGVSHKDEGPRPTRAACALRCPHHDTVPHGRPAGRPDPYVDTGEGWQGCSRTRSGKRSLPELGEQAWCYLLTPVSPQITLPPAGPSGPTPAGLGDDVTGARWPPSRVPILHTWKLTLQRPHPLRVTHKPSDCPLAFQGGPAHTTWGVQAPGVYVQLLWGQQHLAAQDHGWKRVV